MIGGMNVEGSLGLRTGSYGSLQQNGAYISRKPSKMSLSGSREKERILSRICRFVVRKKVGMLVLGAFALLAFMSGFLSVNNDDSLGSSDFDFEGRYGNQTYLMPGQQKVAKLGDDSSLQNFITVCQEKSEQPPMFPNASETFAGSSSISDHPCRTFAFPPPPPGGRRRIGPRPCPVCYVPVQQAVASMPKFPSVSPVLRHLTYFRNKNPVKTEPHGGSDFGGYPSLKQRNDSFNITESMAVHCGFVKGCKPGDDTGFNIDEADLRELEQFHDVIVASAIFGNYDVIQQPSNVSDIARKNVPFYMFVDEETEAYLRNSSYLESTNKVGLWRIIVVRNIPYTDARRNGKVPKLLLHRLFPKIRYSIWIDGKLQLVVDPYQILERFLWRQNATFAISRHYTRFDVFEEANANKAAGKYDNVSIDYQIGFYRKEGLTPYSKSKLPVTSDVPEGCVIIREHIPITNLFTCLWFNEVDRFTSRDQLSFSTVRDKVMGKVDWTINMFLDCERRNFVVQAYHRDLLERRANMTLERSPPPPPALVRDITFRKPPARKTPVKRGKSDKRSGSRRHRKVVAGSRDNN